MLLPLLCLYGLVRVLVLSWQNTDAPWPRSVRAALWVTCGGGGLLLLAAIMGSVATTPLLSWYFVAPHAFLLLTLVYDLLPRLPAPAWTPPRSSWTFRFAAFWLLLVVILLVVAAAGTLAGHGVDAAAALLLSARPFNWSLVLVLALPAWLPWLLWELRVRRPRRSTLRKPSRSLQAGLMGTAP
jgi:hypothetical protein